MNLILKELLSDMNKPEAGKKRTARMYTPSMDPIIHRDKPRKKDDDVPTMELKPGFARLEEKTLDEWRELTVDERKEILDNAEMKELGDRLLADFSNHFGYPEKLTGKDMDDEGAFRLCGAILKDALKRTVDYEAYRYNGFRDFHMGKFNGQLLSSKSLKDLINEVNFEQRSLNTPLMMMFMQELTPDALIKEARITARSIVDQNYKYIAEPYIEQIRKHNITKEELYRVLGLPDDELAEWFHRMYYDRQMAIKGAIKRILDKRKEAEMEVNEE